MENEVMLSTFDNPFNPFHNFDSWLLYDKEKGYDSCERLASLLHITEDMSSVEQEQERIRAIDRLIELDFTNTFIRVTPNTVPIGA